MTSSGFVAIRAAVLTVSDTRTEDNDTSGKAAGDALRGAGHEVVAKTIVTDELSAIRESLAAWIADAGIDCVIATGGTGITARDVTPEAMAPLVTKPIPGFGELFRWLSYEDIGTSTIQSRAEAALCDGTLVFLLPGSTGAVTMALEKIILPQLDIHHRPCNFAQLIARFKE